MNNQKYLAVVGQNLKIPFLFDEAERLGIEIVLFHNSANDADLKSLYSSVTKVVRISYDDENLTKKKVIDEYNERPFNGIMTLFEPLVVLVADIASELQLPYFSKECVEICRNKYKTREALADASLNVPAFIHWTTTMNDLENTSLLYPVVAKPINGFSSQGVIRADTKEQLLIAVDNVKKINEESLKLYTTDQVGVIIEEFIDGPEYVAETFSVNGDVYVLSIGYKGNCRGPYFEEGVYVAPPELSGDIISEIEKQVMSAVKAVKIFNGPAHVELRLNSENKPFVLEIGTRIGGSGVSHFIVQNSTGINFFKLVFEYAMSIEINREDLCPLTEKRIIGNYIIPIQGSGIFEKIENMDTVKKMSNILRILEFIEPGCSIRPYPFFSVYPGVILSQHGSYTDCFEFYRYLDANLKLVYKSS